MKIARSLFLLFILFCPVFLSTIPVDAAEKQTQRESSLQTKDTVEILRAQIDIMRQYDQRLLSTVYWSLGATGTIAVLLLGFGWYANFRIYERDKATLLEQLRIHLKEETASLNQKLTESAKEYRADALKAAQSAATTSAERLEQSIKYDVHRLTRDIRSVEYQMNEQASLQWAQREVYTNALRAECKMLKIALEIDPEFLTTRALDAMHQTMKKIQEGTRVRPDAFLIGEVTMILDQVPPKHSIAVETLRKLLLSIRSS